MTFHGCGLVLKGKETFFNAALFMPRVGQPIIKFRGHFLVPMGPDGSDIFFFIFTPSSFRNCMLYLCIHLGYHFGFYFFLNVFFFFFSLFTKDISVQVLT